MKSVGAAKAGDLICDCPRVFFCVMDLVTCKKTDSKCSKRDILGVTLEKEPPQDKLGICGPTAQGKLGGNLVDSPLKPLSHVFAHEPHLESDPNHPDSNCHSGSVSSMQNNFAVAVSSRQRCR